MEKRIVISGYYGSKNAGDEAMLSAMLEVLEDKDPTLHITVISAAPEDTKKRHGVESISWLNLTAIALALLRADLLISGGGSLLQNVTSKRSLYYYLAIILLALVTRTRVMLYAQGIGPILGGTASFLMRHIVNHVDFITVRDEGSLSELARLGITRPPIEQTADPVLAIRPSDTAAGKAIFARYQVPEGRPVVGISVRNWRHEEGFKEAMAQAADRIFRELEATVLFLPMQYPEDVRAAESIAERMEEKAILLADEYTTAEFLSLVGNMDLMIAIRLHALIFASVMGIPMVGVSYDPKVERFLATIGEESVGSLESVDAEAIFGAAEQKWAGRKAPQALPEGLRSAAAKNADIAERLLDS